MVAIVLVAVWELFRIRSDLDAGRRALDELTLERAASEGLEPVARDAAEHLQRAADRAGGSPALRLIGSLPVIDDQLSSIRRMTRITADLGASAVEAATRIDPRLEAAGGPRGRIDLLDVAMEEADRIAAELADVDLGRPGGLVGPLRGAHEDLVHAIDRAQIKLADGRELVAPVRELLAGPSTILLLAANNAEMAGGAGLALSAGLMTIEQGQIDLGEVIPAGDLRLDRSVPLPADLARIYAPTGVGIDFRSATRSPNLPLMGPVIADMVSVRGVTDLDGVVVVDAVALQGLMEITGPIDVDGREIGASNVLAEVLNENYKQFDTTEERPERVSYQGDIAKAVFDALTERDVSAANLADALLDAAEGRHVMLWAVDPDLQQVWSELGVAGELHPLGLMVSFQNYAANKLDWYLRPEAALDVRLTPNGDYRAHLTMTMPVPAFEELADASAYILGPTPEKQGLFLTVHLPASAYDITTPHPSGFRTKGIDPPMQVRTFLVDVPVGTTFERSIDFTLPREVGAMLLLPSARLEPLPLTVDGVVTVDDSMPRIIGWLAADPGRTPSNDPPVIVRLATAGGALSSVAASGALARSALPRGRGQRPDRGWLRRARIAAAVALGLFAVAGVLALVLATPRV